MKRIFFILMIFLTLITIFEVVFYFYYSFRGRHNTTAASNLVSPQPTPNLTLYPIIQDRTMAISPGNVQILSSLRKVFVKSAKLQVEELGIIINIRKDTTKGGSFLNIKDISGGPSVSEMFFSNDDLKLSTVTEALNNNQQLNFTDLKIGDRIKLVMTFDLLYPEDEKLTSLKFFKYP